MAETNNHAPVATDDEASVYQREIVYESVVHRGTNDTDVDGDEIIVTQIASGGVVKPVTTGGTSIKGKYGDLEIDDYGSFSYDANAEGIIAVGERVTDTFTYTISDGRGGQDSAKLFVDVIGSDVGDYGSNTFLLTGVGKQASGQEGDDTYYVDSSSDRVIEAVGGGDDLIRTSNNYALGAGQEIETLATRGAATTTAINLTGNAFEQTLQGNAGANVIDGRGGVDVLSGYGGDDTFAFSTLISTSTRDIIRDFSHTDDTFQLAKEVFTVLPTGELADFRFKDIGDGARVDSSDRIIYNHDNGQLFYDRDGSGSTYARVQIATLTNEPTTLDYTDFTVFA